MHSLETSIEFATELNDQLTLLKKTLREEQHLTKEDRKIVAWAAAVASQSVDMVELICTETGTLTTEEKRMVNLANSRMSVTNPYYMSRNVFPLNSGGTLEGLSMRPFQALNIVNEISYHYACVAISSVNHGFACFTSHMNSLRSLSQSDAALDQALRLTAAILAVKQIMFNTHLDYLK